MAIHIQSGKNCLNNIPKNSNIQSLPFKVHADCDAAVSTYFEPYVKEAGKELLTASFRGRPLSGKKITLPKDYLGVVFHESTKPSTEHDERKFYVIHQFNEMRYWNWDKIPSANDPLLMALDWIDIAEALHAPVEE